MPLSIRTTAASKTTEAPFSADQLPEELYIKIVFDDHARAAKWCADVVGWLENVQGYDSALAFHRVVIWGPKPLGAEYSLSGQGTVYVSELAIRLLRAIGPVRVSRSEITSLGQLEYDMHMYVGSADDQRAYDEIRGD